jgi:hypothetical protein
VGKQVAAEEVIVELFEQSRDWIGRKVKVAEMRTSDISPADLGKILQLQKRLGRTWKIWRKERGEKRIK